MQKHLYPQGKRSSGRAESPASDPRSDRYEITCVNDLDLYHVHLSQETFEFATTQLGPARIKRAEEMGLKDKWGKNDPASHEKGAVCETAQRFLFGLDPFAVPEFDHGGPDIPPNIQCRGTDKSPSEVWVRPPDDPGWIVVGSRWYRRPRKGSHVVTVWGWILVGDVQGNPSFKKRNPGGKVPAWPVHFLRLSNLTPLLEEHWSFPDRTPP